MQQEEILLTEVIMSSILINFLNQNFKRQNDVLTKVVKAIWLKFASTFIGIISTGIMMYKYMSPDTTMRTAGLVAAGASTMLNRTNTLVNGPSYGYDNVNDWL